MAENQNRDYYKTLGVAKNATPDEIKSAYRKLAREWHPDVAKTKPDAEAKFKEINEAYQVLSDPQKRSQYDQLGSAFKNSASGNGFNASGFGGEGFNPFGQGGFQWSSNADFGDVDPFDIFEQVFGFRGFGSSSRRGRSIRYNLTIEFEDSIKGFEETLNIDGKKLKVKLPPGVLNGTQVKFEGMGDKGEHPNMPPGDLYVMISIKENPDMHRDGFDTISQKTITMAQAALGVKIPIKVVDPKSKNGYSDKELKIPEGTQSGTQFRLRGLGMPHPRGFGRGDHYVSIKVEIPKKLNKKQKEALKELF